LRSSKWHKQTLRAALSGLMSAVMRMEDLIKEHPAILAAPRRRVRRQHVLHSLIVLSMCTQTSLDVPH